MLTFAPAKMKQETVFWFDRDTHQLNYENRERIFCQWRATISHDIAVKPVDYKGGEHSNLIDQEFSSHHRYGLFS